jgi:hypothetical protein
MIDFKKVGLAASRAHGQPGTETEDGLYEEMGRAAVAAMIPALLPFGCCDCRCPFDKSARQCSLGWKRAVARKEEEK